MAGHRNDLLRVLYRVHCKRKADAIMKIDPTKIAGVSQARRSEKTRKAGSASFSELLGEANETAAPGQAVATKSVDALVAVQEVGDRDGNARRARDRAEEMLEKLEAIRNGLLMGGIPTDQLRRLADMASERREAFTDPRLSEILDDIELRARVELAKYDPRA